MAIYRDDDDIPVEITNEMMDAGKIAFEKYEKKISSPQLWSPRGADFLRTIYFAMHKASLKEKAWRKGCWLRRDELAMNVADASVRAAAQRSRRRVLAAHTAVCAEGNQMLLRALPLLGRETSGDGSALRG